MATPVILTSFAGGELSGSMYARVDLDKYHVGAALLRNFFVDYRGGVSNRAGTIFVDHCASDIENGVRLIPFVVSQDQSYVLEFSENLIRIFLQQELVDSVVTTYAADDLFELRYEQSADVMTITHPAYPIYNLSRTSLFIFSFDPVVIGPQIAAPTGLIATATVTGTLKYAYQVTAVTANGEESLPSTVVTEVSAALDPTNATPRTIALTWDPVADADAYNIYKAGPVESTQADPTVLGYIGQSTDENFVDSNIGPDFALIPPEFFDPFADSKYPTCVSYYQQRRSFGGADITPTVIDLSQTGFYDNFDVSPAVLDSDAISMNIASREVNRVKHLVPMQTGLIAFTNGNAFLIHGAEGAGITPTNAAADPQASTGAGSLRPIVVNYNVLFNSYQGTTVRDLTFNFQTSSYYGEDRSRLANHLFYGKFLVDWAWAEDPFKLLWVIRNDGVALTMTYMPEQEVYGWARHDTNGMWKSVCSVPEGTEDAVYFVARRYIQGEGVWRNFLERLQDRLFDCGKDTWFLDCAVSLPATAGTTELTFSGTTGTIVITAGGPLTVIGDFLMEAKESIDPEQLALMQDAFDNTDFSLWDPSADGPVKVFTALGYDPVRRKMMYNIQLVDNAGTITNDTGFRLWDGTFAIELAEAYNNADYNNFYTMERDLDTGVVTRYTAFDPTFLVPAGIGGSDGTDTVHLMDCNAGLTNGPQVIDPRTGDMWVHVFGTSVPCSIYLLRREDDFAQIISPLVSIPTNSGHMEPVGLTDNYFLVLDQGVGQFVVGSPRTIQAAEFTADYKLPYWWFETPEPLSTHWIRWMVNEDNTSYYLFANKTGARQYTLYRLDEPTAAIPFNAGTVGGGFTDVTPWGPATGPNSNVSGYILEGDYNHSGGYNRNILMQLPDTNSIAIITKLLPADNTLNSRDPSLLRFDMTFVNLGDSSFEYHEGFVYGYMKGNTAETFMVAADQADADWVVRDILPVDIDLDEHSYDFSTVDRSYTTRTFKFLMQPVVEGVWSFDDSTNHVLIVLYDLSDAEAGPVVLQVYDEALWYDNYSYMGLDSPMYGVLRDWQTPGINGIYNSGFYDAPTAGWYWSGYNANMPVLDTDYAWRLSLFMNNMMPFVKISLGGGDTFINVGCGVVQITGLGEAPFSYIGDIVQPIDIPLVPNDPFNTPLPIPATAWSFTTPATSIDVSHLIGMRVGLVTDGIVNEESIVPESGIVEFPLGVAYRAVCGLPYTAQFKSLKLDVGEPTIQGRRKTIPAVTARLQQTLGVTFGTEDFNSQLQVKELASTDDIINRALVVGTFSPLYDGDARVNVFAGWSTNGVLTAQQTFPMPVTILGLIPEVLVGDNQR